jgi:hypothetical protein
MKSNRKSGKISLLVVAMVAVGGMILASMVFAKEDPSAVGGQFMDALARHDFDKLTELSHIDSTDPATIESEKKRLREEWNFSVNVAGQHYPFVWRITSSTTASPDTASVAVQVSKGGPGGVEEKFELPLEKSGGKWKVVAGSISRLMFPAMPN